MARKSYSDKEREQVKEALLITVLESIVNQGLVHSSIAILCEKVGISKTFFYACIEKHEMIQAEALEREMEAFHRRRILCMVEIFSKIDCGILFSGYVELDTYFKNVWDYAHQRIAAEQLREVQEYLRSQIPWKSLSSQRMDLGAELLNFWCGEDELDWGYSQYFEIAAGNLKPFLAMTLFTEILCKHFPDVMSAPVKRLSSKL